MLVPPRPSLFLIIIYSLSEHGCNTNTRTFGDVKALYSSQMTGVYSGGLVYEYSQEEANYGLVTINGNSVSERPDFKALKTAYAGTPVPTGDGGYQASLPKSKCPAPNANWAVTNDTLPIIPAKAKTYLTAGAGTPPGLDGNNGDGSQWGEDPSPGFAASATSDDGSSSSSSGSAASSLRVPELSAAPFVCALVVLVSSLVGASVL